MMEMVSATATRRDVFAMKPAGFPAAGDSDIAVEDTFIGGWSDEGCRSSAAFPHNAAEIRSAVSTKTRRALRCR
jgi:hypothetical protein